MTKADYVNIGIAVLVAGGILIALLIRGLVRAFRQRRGLPVQTPTRRYETNTDILDEIGERQEQINKELAGATPAYTGYPDWMSIDAGHAFFADDRSYLPQDDRGPFDSHLS